MLGGRQVTRFKRDGKQYDVIVQLEDVDRTTPDDLARSSCAAATARWSPLSNLVRIEETVAPEGAQPLQQAALGDASPPPWRRATRSARRSAFLRRGGRETLPPGVRHRSQRPEPRVPQPPTSGLYITFLLALAFIYLVLAAQFESLDRPARSSC